MTDTFFEWRAEYETGIRLIDSDHKQLFDLAKALNEEARAPQADRDIAPLIDRLVAYVDAHFAREERIMAKSGFPQFDAHVAEHRRATEVIHAIREIYRRAPSDLNVKKVAMFFRDWLAHHIMGNDQRYVPYVRGEKPGIKFQSQARDAPRPWVDFVSVTVDVPADREAALRKCARLLSHVGPDTERLEACLADLADGPSPGRLAFVAKAFTRSSDGDG